MSIGKKIKQMRLAKDMTLEELSKLVHVSRQTLSRYENEIINNIPSDRIEKIAQVLDTSPIYLMGWEDNGDRLARGRASFDIAYKDHSLDEEMLLQIMEEMDFPTKADRNTVIAEAYKRLEKQNTKKSPTPEESEAEDNITPISQAFDKQTRQHIEKYTALDNYGKRAVDIMTDNEFDRMTHQNEMGQKIDIEQMMTYRDKSAAGLGFELGDGSSFYFTPVISNKFTRKADFMVQVQGRSMEPRFYDGEFVLVQEQDDVDFGDIGIWVVNGKGYIKQKDDDYLRSLNPKYPDVHFSEWDEYRCAGKVISTLDPDWIVK